MSISLITGSAEVFKIVMGNYFVCLFGWVGARVGQDPYDLCRMQVIGELTDFFTGFAPR